MFICNKLYENPRIIERKPADNEFMDTKMNQQIVLTANPRIARAACMVFHPLECLIVSFSVSILTVYCNKKDDWELQYIR